MLAKKVRTEYMKKFKDPKWETFSKCYEDSLRYRLTRRVMEHSHKPWFWEGWDSGSDSSGWSTPKLTRNKVAPLPLPPPPPASSSEVKQRLLDLKPKVRPEEEEEGTGGAPPVEDLQTGASIVVNGVNGAGEALGTAAPPATSGPSDGSATDNGPADSASSDGEPRNPAPRRRHRCRVSRSEPAQQAGSHDDKTAGLKKPRAKSQPPFSTKESRRASSRLDWTERMTESHTFDACTQTRREADKRPPDLDRRRARSADLEKRRRKQLVAAAEDRWTTEYMRCFSARVRDPSPIDGSHMAPHGRRSSLLPAPSPSDGCSGISVYFTEVLLEADPQVSAGLQYLVIFQNASLWRLVKNSRIIWFSLHYSRDSRQILTRTMMMMMMVMKNKATGITANQ